MIDRPTKARIPLIDVASLPADQRALAGIGASNVLRTLAHRGDLTAAWLAFGMRLTTEGRLSARTRELVILRVGLRSWCEYEWANHVAAALGAGVTPAEIESLAGDTGPWSAADEAVLGVVDDLCTDDCVSAGRWEALAATHDNDEIIELLMLIGFYRMNAGLLNSLGVQTEPGRPQLGEGLPDQAPAPARRPVDASGARAPSEARPAGTWHITFHHPAGTQELRLVLATSDGTLSGSVTNPAIDVEVPISAGTVQGNRITCTTVMTNPFPATITWEGTIDGDLIAGTVMVNDTGPFEFDGSRVPT